MWHRVSRRNFLAGIMLRLVVGLVAASVITIYLKGSTKNGEHSAVDHVAHIIAISYVAVQVFHQSFLQQFRTVTNVTAPFHCNYFALLPSTTLLTVLRQLL
jgi:hypothetical protein